MNAGENENPHLGAKKAKKSGPHPAGAEALKSAKGVRPLTEKQAEPKSGELPEFEYEYLQEKLYLEEIFNTFYLSFDSPGQSAGGALGAGRAASAAQYSKLLQQEKVLLDELQTKPLQAGMALDDQSEAALMQQMEMAAAANGGSPPPGMPPEMRAKDAQSNLATKMQMLLKSRELGKQETPESVPETIAEEEAKAESVEVTDYKAEAEAAAVAEEEEKQVETEEKSETKKQSEPAASSTPATATKPVAPFSGGAASGAMGPGLSAVLHQKTEHKKKKEGKVSDSNTKVLRSIYLSFPLKKPIKAGGAVPKQHKAGKEAVSSAGPAQPEGPGNICEKEFSNGSYYKGEWLRGQPQGEGTLISSAGFVYQGRFVNGKFHGYGEKQMPNGVVYKGYWSNGQMEGKAKLTFPDGDTYLGTFKDNKFEGEGLRRFPNGDMYRGQYHDGYQHGYGVFISMEEGWKYIGQWNKGKIHGKGLCIWVDGTVYDGDVFYLVVVNTPAIVGELDQGGTGCARAL